MISRPIAFFCLALTLSVSISAQKLDKPLHEWGREDAIRLVTESAWAKSYQSTTGAARADQRTIAREQGQGVTRGGSDPRSVARDFGPPPVWFRLHSGLPIRMAIVRLQQIDAGYDKMSGEDRAKFDAGRKGFLDCSICKDYYVLTINRSTDSTSTSVEEGVFQGMTLEDLKGNVKLVNDKGEERELAAFNAPKNVGDRTVFYFKRADDAGNHLITPATKDFRLVFSNEFLDSQNRFAYLLPRTMEFKVSKLLVGEKLLF